MRAVCRDGQLLPLLNIRRRDRLQRDAGQRRMHLSNRRTTYAIVRRLRVVPIELRDLRHGLDADNTLNREVRLVRKRASEAVRAELLRRLQRVRDEEMRPLIEEVVLQGQVRDVLCHGRATLT